MKKLSTFFLITLFMYAEQPALPIEFLEMTTTVTVMPTVLPTYVTIAHFNPPPHVKRREEIKKFISENFEFLKVQIAKGEGEHLDTLGLLYELENVSLWKKRLQSSFEDIYQEERSEEEIYTYIDDMTHREFNVFKIYSVEEYDKRITPLPDAMESK